MGEKREASRDQNGEHIHTRSQRKKEMGTKNNIGRSDPDTIRRSEDSESKIISIPLVGHVTCATRRVHFLFDMYERVEKTWNKNYLQPSVVS